MRRSEDRLHAHLALCGIALVVEALAGYSDRLFAAIGHPVTWIGAGIDALDRRFNRNEDAPDVRRRNGIVAIGLFLAGCALAATALAAVVEMLLPDPVALLVLGVLASSCLAQRSLDDHVRAVADALDAGGVDAGRAAVARIVGRDVAALDAAGVARAAIESLAENFSDGIVAPALWLALFGLPGGVLLKAINTADSMIGHRTPRHAAFGFFAAKVDDAANWPAARIAALALVAAAAIVPGASAREAWRILRRDASGHPSPNAGRPEAAMAGALGVTLGGPRSYGGATVADGCMGDGGARADAAAIRRALGLYRVACLLEIAVVVGLATLTARW